MHGIILYMKNYSLFKKIISFCFFGTLLFSPNIMLGQESQKSNVGIIQGIWFSKTPFFDGQPIRIYSAIQNNSGADVHGYIEFFDNKKLLGKKNFSVLNHRIAETWIDTTAVAGEHEFSVKITELQKDAVGKKLIPVASDSLYSKKMLVIKIDTDGDGTPDDIDNDDDNDGYPDDEERKKGSDPLKSNDIPADTKKNSKENNQTSLINHVMNIFSQEKKGSGNSSMDDGEASPDSSLDSQENPKEKVKSEKTELENQTPKIVTELANQQKIVKVLVNQVDVVQKHGSKILVKEKTRIDKKQQNLKSKKATTQNSNSEVSNVKSQKILTILYQWCLGAFIWLFSTWWFVVILLFFAIYVLMRVLFNLFGSR